MKISEILKEYVQLPDLKTRFESESGVLNFEKKNWDNFFNRMDNNSWSIDMLAYFSLNIAYYCQYLYFTA